MSRPMTNWWPRMRMACLSAARATGSPSLPTSREYQDRASPTSLRSSATTRPVSIRSPGGRVHQHGFGVAQMFVPGAARNLVGDEPVRGLAIGNAQQRFGQAHEDHALARGQAVLAQEGVERAAPAARRAHRLHQRQRPRAGVAAAASRQPRLVGQCTYKWLFFGEILRIDRLGDGVRPFEHGKLCHGGNSIELAAGVPIAGP